MTNHTFYDHQMSLLPAVQAMCARGVRVDDALRMQRIRALGAEAERIEHDVEVIVEGVKDRLQERKLFWTTRTCKRCRNGKKKKLTCAECEGVGKFTEFDFNLSSPRQLGDVLYNGLRLPRRSRGGKTTTDEEALKSLLALDKSGFVERALRYAKLDTMRDIYGRISPHDAGCTTRACTCTHDFHVRTVFNVAGTYTGRFSSSEAFYVQASTNLQNLPHTEAKRDPLFAVRDCVTPDAGEVFLYADLSQAEARVSAVLSEDWELLERWRDPKWDAHIWTASNIFNKAESAITSRERQLGKTVRHACVDALTEVLTPSGWEPIATLPERRKVAQWEPNGRISWVVPEIVKLAFAGELRIFEGRAFSQALTPDHRMPYITNENLKVSTPDSIPRGGRLPLTGNFFDGTEALSKAYITLIAATQADGSYEKKKSGHITFHLKKTRKIERLEAALKSVRATWRKGRREKSGAYRIVIRDEATKSMIKRWLSPEKTFDAKLLNLANPCLKWLLDELPLWDGGVYRDGARTAYYTAIYENAMWAQTVAHLCGKQGLLRQKVDGTYEVSFNRRVMLRVPNKQLKHHNGPVWCLTVPSSFFLVRRRDRISITGNCNYGMGPNKFWRTVNDQADLTGIAITSAEAKTIWKAYHALHPKLDEVWWNRVQRTLEARAPMIAQHCGWSANLWPRFADDGTLDHESLRKGIAWEPQHTVAHVLNEGLKELYDNEQGRFRVLLQAHDAVLLGVPSGGAEEVAKLAKSVLERPLSINGYTFTIPAECFLGEHNWSHLRRIL
ncbi:MAG: DNA polymerase [Acidobacteriales bacterium]|nr:DNA polymerase [Terriglobales bacterium]